MTTEAAYIHHDDREIDLEIPTFQPGSLASPQAMVVDRDALTDMVRLLHADIAYWRYPCPGYEGYDDRDPDTSWLLLAASCRALAILADAIRADDAEEGMVDDLFRLRAFLQEPGVAETATTLRERGHLDAETTERLRDLVSDITRYQIAREKAGTPAAGSER